MKNPILKVKDFSTLIDLRNQYEDFRDKTNFLPTTIIMTSEQYDLYDSLLEKWSKNDQFPTTYRGSIIIVGNIL